MLMNSLISSVKEEKDISSVMIIATLKEYIKKFDIDRYTYKLSRMHYIINQLEILKDTELIKIEAFLVEICLWYFIINNKEIPVWLENRYQSLFKKESEVFLFQLNEFQSQGWLIEDVVYDSIQLSSNQINTYQVHNDDFKNWLRIRKNNFLLYLGVVFSGRLIGHLGAVVLNKYEYLEMSKGVLLESQIKSSFEVHKKVNYLYFPTIVIKKEFRRPFLVKRLILDFFHRILNLNEMSNLEKIIVNVYTTEGKRLCEKLGFYFLINHIDGGKVYELDMSDIDNKLNYIISKFKQQ